MEEEGRIDGSFDVQLYPRDDSTHISLMKFRVNKKFDAEKRAYC